MASSGPSTRYAYILIVLRGHPEASASLCHFEQITLFEDSVAILRRLVPLRDQLPLLHWS